MHSLSVNLLLLAMVPSLFVQYRVFASLLTPRDSRRLAGAFVILYLAFFAGVIEIFSQGTVGAAWISFKDVFAVHAIPCLLIGLLFVPSYRLQYIFVLGMQGLFVVAVLTLVMNVELLFVSRDEFFQYIDEYLLAYTLSYALLIPVLLKFFHTVITPNRMVDMLAFWKYMAAIPVLALLYSIILAHTNEPVAREYLVPRMLQASQKRLSIYRHDTRHQLRLLSSLIQEKNSADSLAFLETLKEELAHTQPYHWGENACMKKALQPLVEEARDEGIHVMADLSLAPELPFEQELGEAAALLTEAAMAESRQQDKETRAVIVIARQTDTAVMLVIGNRQTEPVEMDEEGRPRNGGYARAFLSLAPFMTRHQADSRYTCEEGWMIVNLRIPWKKGDAV